MGRYVYKPITTNYDPTDENQYLENYIKSIKSGELLVDLSNYDLYVTEEGVELPIPITKNLKKKIINFINSLDIEDRTQLLLNNLNKIENIKEKLVDLIGSIEVLDKDLEISYKNLNNHKVYFEKITENNINYLGYLDYDDFSSFPNSYYLTYYQNEINKLIGMFNTILNEQNENFGNLNKYSYKDKYTSKYKRNLYTIYVEILSLYKKLSEKSENLPIPKINITYDKTIKYTENSNRNIYKIQQISKTIQSKVYDFAYITLACNQTGNNILEICKKGDSLFNSTSYTNVDWDFTEDIGAKRYKVLTNEDIGYFNSSNGGIIEGWTYERLWYDGGRGDWNSESNQEFRPLVLNDFESEGLYHPFFEYELKSKQRPYPYRETFGNQFWRRIDNGDIKINPNMKNLVANYDSSTGIWIPKEVNNSGNIITNNKKFITEIPQNYRAFTNTNKYCDNNIIKRLSKYGSLSFGIGKPIEHNTTLGYDSSGSYNCWRMIKVIYSKTINKTIKINKVINDFEVINNEKTTTETKNIKI